MRSSAAPPSLSNEDADNSSAREELGLCSGYKVAAPVAPSIGLNCPRQYRCPCDFRLIRQTRTTELRAIRVRNPAQNARCDAGSRSPTHESGTGMATSQLPTTRHKSPGSIAALAASWPPMRSRRGAADCGLEACAISAAHELGQPASPACGQSIGSVPAERRCRICSAPASSGRAGRLRDRNCASVKAPNTAFSYPPIARLRLYGSAPLPLHRAGRFCESNQARFAPTDTREPSARLEDRDFVVECRQGHTLWSKRQAPTPRQIPRRLPAQLAKAREIWSRRIRIDLGPARGAMLTKIVEHIGERVAHRTR